MNLLVNNAGLFENQRLVLAADPDARARYARDPARYERGMTKLLKAAIMDTGR